MLISLHQIHIVEVLRRLNIGEREGFVNKIRFVDFEQMDNNNWNKIIVIVQLFYHMQQQQLSLQYCRSLADTETLLVRKSKISKNKNLKNKGAAVVANGGVCLVLTLHCFADDPESQLPSSSEKLFLKTELPSGKPLLKLYLQKLVYLIRSNYAPKTKVYIIVDILHEVNIKSWVAQHCQEYSQELDIQIFPYSPTIPNIGLQGEVLFEDDKTFSFSPGKGDLLLALKSMGIIDLILNRIHKYVWFGNPQNLLQKPCDPLIIGYMEEQNIEVMAKVMESTVQQEASKALYAVTTSRQNLAIKYTKKPAGSERALMYAGSLVMRKNYLCKSLYAQLKPEANESIETRRIKVNHYDVMACKIVVVQEPNALVFSRTPKDLLVLSKNNRDKVKLMKVARKEECYWLKDTQQPEVILSNYFKSGLLGIEGTQENELVEISPLVGWDQEDGEILQLREKLKSRGVTGFPLEIKSCADCLQETETTP